jgi:hypothetical protein
MRTLVFLCILGSSLAVGGQSGDATKPASANPPFTLSISSNPTVALGTPVEVRVRLINTSNHEINGSTVSVRGFSPAYLYDVRDRSGNVIQQKQIDPGHQGSAQVITLKPGEGRGETTRIDEVFDLWPGTYSIQLSRPVSYDPGASVVKSNKITITVTP